MNIAEIVIAASLVLTALVLMRISLTLGDISASLASKRSQALPSAAADKAQSPASAAGIEAAQDSAPDDNEIAAVIAIASAALRQAV